MSVQEGEAAPDFTMPASFGRSVSLAGQLWGEPGKSSYKYEPECAFIKPATDVVLIGHENHRIGGVGCRWEFWM